MFGGGPPPPQLPPPPPNPPSYGDQIFAPPTRSNTGIFGGMDNSIMTTPFGAPDQRATQRKSLFGQ